MHADIIETTCKSVPCLRAQIHAHYLLIVSTKLLYFNC